MQNIFNNTKSIKLKTLSFIIMNNGIIDAGKIIKMLFFTFFTVDIYIDCIKKLTTPLIRTDTNTATTRLLRK